MESFDELYNLFSPQLERYLNSYFSVEDTQDLKQEIFLKIHSALPGFRGDSNLKTWMYRIATNTVIDRLRSNAHQMTKNRERIEKVHYNISHFAYTFDRQIEKAEMNTCIRKFILQLTEKNKSVFVLSQYQDLTNQEVAEILGISLESVKIRLHRAKETLKTSLAKNCHIYVDEYGEMGCEPV